MDIEIPVRSVEMNKEKYTQISVRFVDQNSKLQNLLQNSVVLDVKASQEGEEAL